ncbi:MAG: carbamoyltransferase HypF [Candidatus Eisenbacteria bacterium]|nr:carbamoyltransferase HypF [Candidatus Eisenbacteria bacterium]
MRPFVYRIAHRHDVTGWVMNSSRGVVIEAEGRGCCVDAFCESLRAEAPPLARIVSVEREEISERGLSGFGIRLSEDEPEGSTLICPDVAVCDQCLSEFLDPSDRRYCYPFINCTDCGPRYSIIAGTPYDRPKTSMAAFTMCGPCEAEYMDPLDRRFHAQPNACPECGPSLSLVTPGPPGERLTELVQGRSYVRMPADVAADSVQDPAAAARWLLGRGALLGVRSLGGFHIAVNARDDASVRALREKKRRPAKPFAVMCASIDEARELAHVSEQEARVLESPWRPIVLLRKREEPGGAISDLVAPRNAYLGIMLPSAPLHYLLFDDELRTLVMTSANAAGEPIATTAEEARLSLGGITRTLLDHDREILNRCDDSVVFVESGRVLSARRSRGYAPYPIELPGDSGSVLATGTELKNSFTVTKDGRAFMSPHIGDLENAETLEFYEETVEKFLSWFGIRPEAVAHDLHPDYLATRFARSFAEERGLPLVGVQHHYAHLAGVAAENGWRGRFIGLSLDGTGYGVDGAIWGCEFLVCDETDFERAGHLAYVPLPGGDAAIRRPYRVAASHLMAADAAEPERLLGTLFRDVPAEELELLRQQIERRVNCVDTSSAGRLFDAVSAVLGICGSVTYEAQAAIELESVAARDAEGVYPYEIREGDAFVVDPGPVFLAVLEELADGRSREVISGRFHNTVADFCLRATRRVSESTGLRTVALAGGVFQNRLLLGRLWRMLERDGFEVLLPREAPINDGGVSLGQAVVANERLKRGKV